jgi:GMC oxidoreductase
LSWPRLLRGFSKSSLLLPFQTGLLVGYQVDFSLPPLRLMSLHRPHLSSCWCDLHPGFGELYPRQRQHCQPHHRYGAHGCVVFLKMNYAFSSPIPTVSVAPRSDGGVVDANLKVYGAKNVYVVDASVIPIEPAAHLQVSVVGSGAR